LAIGRAILLDGVGLLADGRDNVSRDDPGCALWWTRKRGWIFLSKSIILRNPMAL